MLIYDAILFLFFHQKKKIKEIYFTSFNLNFHKKVFEINQKIFLCYFFEIFCASTHIG